MKNFRVSIFIIVSAFGLMIVGCNNSKENLTQAKVDSRIVLIDIGDSDRLKIAKAIEKISECSPKIIAINGIFDVIKDSYGDSALANAIRKSGNVVVPFIDDGNSFIQSDEIFTKGCIGQGVIEMWPANDIMNTFRVSLYNDRREEIEWTFPFAVVNYFDVGNSAYLKETKPNMDYYIRFAQDSLDSNGISIDSLNSINCDILHGRIILMGDIRHGDQEGFFISNDSNLRVSSTVIFAHIISTILSHDFEELKD